MVSQEHDRHLRQVLRRSHERGVKLKRDKLEVGVTQAKYFGHMLTSEGVRPDPDKISAIENPKRQIRARNIPWNGYLAKFAPNLSAITSSLRMLLTKDTLLS